MPITIPKDPDNAHTIMSDILMGKYTTHDIVPFLKQYQIHKPSRDILYAYLTAIQDQAMYTIDTERLKKPVVDIVGTGGDGKHTVNISTLSCLIAASTKNVYTAKYGNKSASGICGSMDILEEISIPITLSEHDIYDSLKKNHFAPLYARSAYPGAKHTAEARSIVQGATIFNTLFPLARPMKGPYTMIFGVADFSSFDYFAQILSMNKTATTLIVHGNDGTDEISVTGDGTTKAVLIKNGTKKNITLNCHTHAGIPPVPLSSLQITTREEAVLLFHDTLNPHVVNNRVGHIRESVCFNAAVALALSLETSFNTASIAYYVRLTRQIVSSGKPYHEYITKNR